MKKCYFHLLCRPRNLIIDNDCKLLKQQQIARNLGILDAGILGYWNSGIKGILSFLIKLIGYPGCIIIINIKHFTETIVTSQKVGKEILNPDRPLIIKLKISETRVQADLKKKQVR
jgi:hypothetical protein